MQIVKDHLKDVETNEKEYHSSMHVIGIFSFEKDAPIENWLLNSAESLVGSTINLPSDWVEHASCNLSILGATRLQSDVKRNNR